MYKTLKMKGFPGVSLRYIGRRGNHHGYLNPANEIRDQVDELT